MSEHRHLGALITEVLLKPEHPLDKATTSLGRLNAERMVDLAEEVTDVVVAVVTNWLTETEAELVAAGAMCTQYRHGRPCLQHRADARRALLALAEYVTSNSDD